ncbi:MAG: helix-turn-helix domain-containing protein [Treponema sp.]|jgi:hypothetical protein|nr:helix-turn-helix domain-containing protein [Treponema sp.]
MNKFREIIMPGDVLEDGSLSDGAKILYGKIARLSYKDGFCWASNSFLDGTESGSSAKRQITELKEAGYIRCEYKNGYKRRIFICDINSKITKNEEKTDPTQTKNDQGVDQKWSGTQTKNDQGGRPKMTTEHININIQKNKEKEQEPFSESFNLGKPKEDPFPAPSPFIKIPETPVLPQKNYSAIFEEVKLKWKEITGQDTRETLFQVSSVNREKFINTLAIYELKDIFNAMENYWYTKTNPDKYDIGGRTYGDLIRFLGNGVSQFFDDNVVKANFLKK